MDSIIYSSSMNLVDSIIDEIALEGLDGITLEALWKRLAIRLECDGEFSDSFKEQVWNIIKSIKEISFYKLASARPPLIIYDRYQFIDPDFGTILEPDDVPDDIYQHFLINDTKNNIRGSCGSYQTRKLLNPNDITLQLIENELKNHLVIVASQKMRDDALMGDNYCPTIELTPIQYCFLERVGRSRYHGEITQGKRSLNMLKEDPRSLFYHRKFLLKQKLITKQMHHQKHGGHSTSGCLLHLPRFYVERKPKVIYLAERIIDILKNKVNYIADYDEIRRELQLENSIKKLLKTVFFQKVARSDLVIPYRILYPNADPSEYKTKHSNKEKKLRAIQLINPNIDIISLLNKDDFIDDDEIYELDTNKQLINVPFMKQANDVLEKFQINGLSQSELAIELGITKLHARTVLRNLIKLELVSTFMTDIGRQRTTKYVSNKFAKNSDISKLFNSERDRLKEVFNETNKISNGTDKIFNEADNIELYNNSNDKINENPQPDRGKLFAIVNKITNKYVKTKLIKYKVTNNNFNKLNTTKLDNDKKSKLNIITPEIKEELEACQVELEKIEMNISNLNIGELKNLKEEIEKKDGSSVSYRMLKRMNMVIEAVKEHKVIEDTSKLMKMINQEESRDGYYVKIDRKSLMRILVKLSNAKLIKNIKLNIKSSKCTKFLMFICDPTIDINNAIIQSAIEQAKIKFCLPKKRIIQKQSTTVQKKIKKVSSNNNNELNLKTLNVVYDKSAGKQYGYSPKFIKMQVLHLLLFYIVYDHPGPPKLSKSINIENLRSRGYEIDETMENEMGEIYNTVEVDWKMFIPPLSEHFNMPTGWSLMSDILLRLPLSIFVKIFKIPFLIPNFEKYIQHPIRKHYLIKDLPSDLRNTLLIKRKYIFSIHETITRLCFIGLAQFGPQKLKDKDQVFIYLNRRSELLDTTLSLSNHYNTIEDREYPVINYYFDKIQSVEKYWYDMWQICINTQLGTRPPQGTEVIVEDLMKKPEMIKTLKAKEADDAPKFDLGVMPGDRKGAAGLDSAFFSHLKRNWNWDSFGISMNINNKKCTKTQRDNLLSNINPKPIKFSDVKELKKPPGPKTVNVKELKRDDKKVNNKITIKTVDSILKEKLMSEDNNDRKVLPKKVKRIRRVKYDDIDHSALEKMDKLRVDWDSREDNILLVCKVVMMYLCPNPRSQLINFTAVRDVLRSYSLTSYNKTSRACQRRLLYIYKKPQTVHSVALGVEEIKQNYYINKRYGNIINKIKMCKKTNNQDEKIASVFKDLVYYVANKYYDIAQCEIKETIKYINTLQEFYLLYEINHLKKPKSNQDFNNDIKNINDIHISTINSVIYSSMSCGKDRRSWAYQLFKIYQQYPENLLRSTMSKIRADQMVSVKKNYVTAMKRYGNSIPMTSSQYQLSTSYIYKFQSKLPFEVYNEINQYIVKSIDNSEQEIELNPPTGGMIIAICDFLTLNKIDFNIQLPDHVIVLDPMIHECDQTYVRIAKKYQDILSNLEKSYAESKNCKEQEPNNKIQEMKKNHSNQSSEVDSNTNKKITKKENMGWGLSKFDFPNEQYNETFVLESDESDDDDDEKDDYIKFLDGTVVKIEDSHNEIIDDEIQNAFFTAHSDKIDDILTSSALNRLREKIDVSKEIKTKNIKVKKLEKRRITTKKVIEKTNSSFVNDIIKTMDNTIEYKNYLNNGDDDKYDCQRSFTRLALLKMREELYEDLPDSHHAHEYFLVNAFNIYYSLDKNDNIFTLPDYIYNKVVDDLNKFATFPKKTLDYHGILNDLIANDYMLENEINIIYDYIRDKREIGATLKELNDKFYQIFRNKLYDIVDCLTDKRLLLKSGVTETHFIHHNFVDPWLIQSVKISRLQRESMQPLPQGCLYSFNPENDDEKKNENVLDSTKNNEEINPDKNEENNSAKNIRKNRTCLLQTKDIYTAAKKLDLNSAEYINVIVRPWIQIDGVINKSILEKMLSAILAHCITNPGIILSQIQNRFIPALQPYHTRELIEILIKLECLELKTLSKSTTTFFSLPMSSKLNYPIKDDGLSEFCDEMVVEVTAGATIKLSSFFHRFNPNRRAVWDVNDLLNNEIEKGGN